MGCDIHLHTEVKIGGRWHHYSEPSISRIYGLFAKMANVRNYSGIEPISLPKGLPKNITKVTKIDYLGLEPDAHSMSWFSVDEVAKLLSWVDKTEELKWFADRREFGYLFGNDWKYFEKYPNDYPKEIEDFRFVFWFDN